MHHTARMWTAPMDRPVQPPSGCIWCIRSIQNIRIVCIQLQQLGRADAREMRLVGIDQELRAICVDGKAEMVGDRLVHIQPRGPPKGSSKFDALLPVAQILHGIQTHIDSSAALGMAPRAFLVVFDVLEGMQR